MAVSVVLFLTLVAGSASAAPRLAVRYVLSPDQIRTVVASGTLPLSFAGARVVVSLEVQRGGRFAKVAGTKPRNGRFRLGYVATVDSAPTISMRVQVTRGASVIASSALHKVTFGSNYADFNIPASTREYTGLALSSVGPGADSGQAVVAFKPGQRVPRPGGHVALGPRAGLPYGMFAKVLSEHQGGGGSVDAVLEQAAIANVFPGIRYGFDGPVRARLVDASGSPVPNSSSPSGGVVIRGHAEASSADGVFDCKSSGSDRDSGALWSALHGLPLNIEIDDPRVVHSFDAGSVFPRRAPSFLFQFSGEALASIGFEAKTGFSCELSATYRKNHRIQFPIRNIGDVPVVAYLEPSLKFEVSASGKFTFEQRHYFAITLKKQGSDPISFKLSHSSDPTKPTLTASLDATLFAGGDLALLVGGSADGFGAGAGLDGSFGPEFAVSASSSKPGCVTWTAQLAADLAVRLEVWTPAWDHQDDLKLGSLTTEPVQLFGSPYCLPGYNTPAPGGASTPASGGEPATPKPGQEGPGGWTLEPTASVSGSQTSGLAGVSCAAPSSCMAVGRDGTAALAELWDGVAWTVGAAPPGGALSSVSCPTATACTAVGSTVDASGASHTLVDVWNGANWSIQASPDAPGSGTSSLAGVSCVSALSCVAVGSVDGGDGSRAPLIESWDGAHWSVQSAPMPPADFASLVAVSCSTGTSCIAVGNYGGAANVVGTGTPLAEVWDGSTWKLQSIPIGGAEWGYLNSVSCTTPTACNAVGSTYQGLGAHITPLAETWDGTAWTQQASLPDATAADLLWGISCTSGTSCAAVGQSVTSRSVLAESLTGSTWSLTAPVTPPGTDSADLKAVSCASPLSCMAVGFATLPGPFPSPSEALAESFSSG